MEEDMEVEIEPVFEVREIDLDYEFDAARFFDFKREESPVEAGKAELWFESAPTYPPSPFVTNMVMREGSLIENATTSPKCDEEDTSTLHESDPENVMVLEFSALGAINKGNEGANRGISTNIQKILQNALNRSFQLTTSTDLTTYNHLPSDKWKAKSKSAKPMPRSSTLMKPTASQLAKQNRPTQVATSRFQKLQALNSNRSLGNSSVVESQAAKRQKLEGGLLRKVDEVKQQTTLVHKAPKKEGTKDRNATNTKLRLTIPREPELETAHRAQRLRPKNGTEEELVTSVTHRFKARPLNRKVGTYDVTKGTSSKADFIVLHSSQVYVLNLQILKGPSLPVPKKSVPKLPEFQEFHLKTLERAVQLSSAVSSSSIHTNAADKEFEKSCTISANGNGTRETVRPSVMDATSQDVCDTKYNFKARPLNRKIFSSKGDIGVFRNIKRETTVPMEFNFQTQKRVPQNLPVELFSKLSLKSELQPSNGSQMKSHRPTFISTKVIMGSKENRFTTFQPKREIFENE
ncbi:TPX2-LIKE PROTEIN 3 [Hibiscus trionum]|uniref:TPX2-LIKE PROTEIN 3 n=1 Tax=Hibiscus trionum TaxID=183268 RepID=A0A9W7IUS6_HIBTR|nr:TPX2-LIKE PROTEIN 3 [Hibiscus trionum]